MKAPDFSVRLDLDQARTLVDYLAKRATGPAGDLDHQIVAWLEALVEEIEDLRRAAESQERPE